jgi:hypothetical protein
LDHDFITYLFFLPFVTTRTMGTQVARCHHGGAVSPMMMMMMNFEHGVTVVAAQVFFFFFGITF